MGMRLHSKPGNYAIAWGKGIVMGITVTGALLADTTFSVVNANQRILCNGVMDSGWRYTAESRNSDFTQITWRRSGQQPQVSYLTYSSTNSQGEPIYRGAFRANTAVTLVDLSRGNVRSGSRISVNVEEWGWSTGTCGNPVPAAW